jgi:hypothetical protein
VDYVACGAQWAGTRVDDGHVHHVQEGKVTFGGENIIFLRLQRNRILHFAYIYILSMNSG